MYKQLANPLASGFNAFKLTAIEAGCNTKKIENCRYTISQGAFNNIASIELKDSEGVTQIVTSDLALTDSKEIAEFIHSAIVENGYINQGDAGVMVTLSNNDADIEIEVIGEVEVLNLKSTTTTFPFIKTCEQYAKCEYKAITSSITSVKVKNDTFTFSQTFTAGIDTAAALQAELQGLAVTDDATVQLDDTGTAYIISLYFEGRKFFVSLDDMQAAWQGCETAYR